MSYEITLRGTVPFTSSLLLFRLRWGAFIPNTAVYMVGKVILAEEFQNGLPYYETRSCGVTIVNPKVMFHLRGLVGYSPL